VEELLVAELFLKEVFVERVSVVREEALDLSVHVGLRDVSGLSLDLLSYPYRT